MGFKVGDWVIHGFDVCQIKEMEGDRVTSVSDGSFRTSGNSLDCYPFTLDNKRVADMVEYWSKKFHGQHLMINYPDLNRILCDFAARAMSRKNTEFSKVQRDATNEVMAGMDKFCRDLWSYLRSVCDVEIMGFRVWGYKRLER